MGRRASRGPRPGGSRCRRCRTIDICAVADECRPARPRRAEVTTWSAPSIHGPCGRYRSRRRGRLASCVAVLTGRRSTPAAQAPHYGSEGSRIVAALAVRPRPSSSSVSCSPVAPLPVCRPGRSPPAGSPAAPAHAAPAAAVRHADGHGRRRPASRPRHRDRGVRPRLQARRDLPCRRPGPTTSASTTPADAPRPDLRRWHQGQRRRGRHGDRQGDRSGRRHQLPVLDPGPRCRGHEGLDQRRGRDGRGLIGAGAVRDAAAAATAAPIADPAAPPYVLRDATAPAVLPGTVHDVDFPIVDKTMTVAPGYVVQTWTFGGTVPGPTIRVHLGDTVRIHLINQTAHVPLDRLPRKPDGDERPDGRDQARAQLDLHVHGGLRRRLDVPLRHGAGAAAHRQRHVRHGHRRAEGRPPARSTGARPRPERVVPGRAGPAGRLRQGQRRRAGARLPGLQRRRQPVQGQPDPDHHRQAHPSLRARRRAERRHVVPRRRARSSTP